MTYLTTMSKEIEILVMTLLISCGELDYLTDTELDAATLRASLTLKGLDSLSAGLPEERSTGKKTPLCLYLPDTCWECEALVTGCSFWRITT